MATKSMGPVLRAMLAASAEFVAIVGVDVFPEGDIPTEVNWPYGSYQVVKNVADRDLDGSIDGYDADVSLVITSLDYDECQAAMSAATNALDAIAGTFAGVKVVGTQADAADQPNGPVDVDGAEGFQGEVSVSLRYED